MPSGRLGSTSLSAAVGVAGLELNSFFTEIRSTIVDPVTIATSKIPTKKVEVINMPEKVTKALAEPPSLEAIVYCATT